MRTVFLPTSNGIRALRYTLDVDLDDAMKVVAVNLERKCGIQDDGHSNLPFSKNNG